MTPTPYLRAVMRALRFYTQLPLPALRFEADPFAPPAMDELAPAVPVAGAVVGLVGGAVLAAAMVLGLPALPAAILAVAAMVAATGAMHEDAVADVADAFFGGATIERRLEILKDPRLGAFGAAALTLTLMLRVAVVAALADQSHWSAGAAMVAAAGLSRPLGLWPLVALPPARGDGAGAAAGRLARAPWRIGLTLGALFACLAIPAGGVAGGLVAFALAASVAFGVVRLADRKLGGQTGDVCGAATLGAEVTFLTVLLAFSGA